MEQEKTLLRHLRRDRELSLDRVAADTGINISIISKAERRLVPLTDAQKTKLGEYFKVDGNLLQEDWSKGVAA